MLVYYTADYTRLVYIIFRTMNELKNNHPVHAAGFAVAGALLAKIAGYDTTKQMLGFGAIAGAGSLAYMQKYGHSLPGAANNAAVSGDEMGVSHPDPVVDQTHQPATTTPIPLPSVEDDAAYTAAQREKERLAREMVEKTLKKLEKTRNELAEKKRNAEAAAYLKAQGSKLRAPTTAHSPVNILEPSTPNWGMAFM